MAKKQRVARPKFGFVIIEGRIRDGFKKDKKTIILPPADFFIVDPGQSEFKEGTEVILDGVARLTPLFKNKEIYVVNQTDIIAFYE